MTVRLIKPNDTVSKTVITVSAETVDLHEGRWLFYGCAIKALIYEKSRHWDTSFHFLDIKNHKDTKFAIGGLLADLHQSPLTLLFIFQDSLATLWLITSKIVQPTDKWSIISWRHLWEVVLEFLEFHFSWILQFLSPTKGLKWFGQDQGLPVQALKRVGMLPVIFAATVNRHPPCSHLLFNMCSPWLPLWRS